MGNFNIEYYTFFPVWKAGTPTVDFSDANDPFDFPENDPITEYDTLKFEFAELKPKNPVMPDFLCGTEPDSEVFSEKIIGIINKYAPKGNQIVPATLYDPNNKKTYNNYYYIHTYVRYNCLDMEKSHVKTFSIGGDIMSVDKVVFDDTILNSIPLNERLIFRLGEWDSLRFIHKSIVDELMDANVTGIRFVKAQDYHAGSAFD